MVPVTPQVDRIVRDHDEVKRPLGDGRLTAGTYVLLGSLIRLHGSDGQLEKIAHAMTPMVAARAMTTIAMSAADLS